jgi:hypothetical protein
VGRARGIAAPSRQLVLGTAAGEAERIDVIDTSSVIAIRQQVMAQAKAADVEAVHAALAERVERGAMTMPEQVIEELLRGKADAAASWAARVRAHAVRLEDLAVYQIEILARVPDLVDPNNTSSTDEADPWVVALALAHSRRNLKVRVVTEDFKDREGKTAIASACGLFDIPTTTVRPFLRDLKIWPR